MSPARSGDGPRPRLSVIVTGAEPVAGATPVAGAELAASATLAALAAEPRDGVEIILAVAGDSAPEGQGWDRIVRCSGPATLPRRLGAAIAASRGDVVAVLDSQCPPAPGWTRAVLAAHAGSAAPVIGGAVEPGGLRGTADWAAYFLDYARFMPPLAAGPLALVPGINVSMKRWALGRGRRHVAPEFWKAFWCGALRAEGLALAAGPQAVVRYGRRTTLPALLAERFHHGRCYAGMRGAALGTTRRVWFALGSPALPALLLARMLRDVLPRRRRWGRLALALPAIVLAVLAWSLGELCGYVAGPGGSCAHVR